MDPWRAMARPSRDHISSLETEITLTVCNILSILHYPMFFCLSPHSLINSSYLGTTRFKSRSFEAWQKSGGKHLFPVDPRTTPYEERPYMQRRNGDWEGKDLSSKGYKGKGQGVAGFRLKIDGVYEKAKAEGKLDSASILGGVPLPWTKKDTEKVGAQSSENVQGARAQTGRRLSDAELARRKAKLVKPTFKKTTKGTKSAEPVAAAPEKKKGLFGMF